MSKSLAQYRRDIDGLRAIAVLAVLFFHADIPAFSGGFVGVDVFFVISGYLISALIIEESDAGRFSYRNFYDRRIRRILPAATVVIACALFAGIFLLLPDQLASLGTTAIVCVFFVGNFIFAKASTYFQDITRASALLHFWSLGVEEQFYLLWPISLIFLRKRLSPRNLSFALCAILLVSLGISQWGVIHNPSYAFFLLPSRIWEFMLGAIISHPGIGVWRARWKSECLALAGLAMLGWAIGGYNSLTEFPGINALLPCLGAAALIVAGKNEDARVPMLVGSAPLRGIGLISYSLYLWHWPLFYFAAAYVSRPLNAVEKTAILLASGVLAWQSWYFVEQPFRRPQPVGRVFR